MVFTRFPAISFLFQDPVKGPTLYLVVMSPCVHCSLSRSFLISHDLGGLEHWPGSLQRVPTLGSSDRFFHHETRFCVFGTLRKYTLATQLHALIPPHLVKMVFARLLQFKVAIFSLPALLFASESLSPPFRARGGKRAGI